MLRIKELKILPELKILLVFSNDEKKIMDFRAISEQEVFLELKDPGYFAQVQNRGYFIEWPHEQDLSAETLYAEGKRPIESK